MQVPKSYYTLSVDSRNMGLYSSTRSYILAFPLRTHATYVQNFAHASTPLRIIKASEPLYHGQDEDDLIFGVEIRKRPSRPVGHMTCMMRQFTLDEIMLYPITKAIGIMFVAGTISNTKSSIVYKTSIVRPNLTTSAVYKQHMLEVLYDHL